MPDTLGSVLRRARKQRGLVMREVGEAVGVSPQAVGQWETDRNEISMENLRSVCGFLKIDIEAATRGELKFLDDDPRSEIVRLSNKGSPNFGPLEVDVLGVGAGGDDGGFEFNGQIIERVRRPPGIATLTNVWALYIIGTSMIPRFEEGELAYAGGRAPVPGDYVVIELFPEEGKSVGKGFVKRLVRRTASEIIVEQFNPAKQLKFDPYEIKGMTRIIPWRELLGF